MAAKKTVVRTLVESGFAKVSEVCRAIGLQRSSFYWVSQRSPESIELEREVLRLSKDNPRYGYRRITALMRREGHKINSKRVQAIRRRHGLQVRKKQRKSRRVNENEPKRLRASAKNEVWSWDFVYDQTEHGSSFRILSVLDEYTRQCHSLNPRHSYRAEDVIEVLEELIVEHGPPRFIRSDNGPEFIAYKIRDWLKEQGIQTHYITLGSPWEQCYIESFHDKLRDEFLNREIFYSLAEAKILLEGWRKEYNDERIHSSLAYLTPNEFARSVQTPLRATPSTPSVRELIPNLIRNNIFTESTV
ncbi:IS3 family transposase [Rubritalea spongiae]